MWSVGKVEPSSGRIKMAGLEVGRERPMGHQRKKKEEEDLCERNRTECKTQGGKGSLVFTDLPLWLGLSLSLVLNVSCLSLDLLFTFLPDWHKEVLAQKYRDEGRRTGHLFPWLPPGRATLAG